MKLRKGNVIDRRLSFLVQFGEFAANLDLPNTEGAKFWEDLLGSYIHHGGTAPSPSLNLDFSIRESPNSILRTTGVSLVPTDRNVLPSFKIEMPTFRGILECSVNGYKGKMSVFRDDFPWYNDALWVCLSVVCANEGQLLIHASGVCVEGKVWLFCGPSGSGKTTIALQLHGHGVPFSVDRVIVKPRSDRTLTAFSTPFGSEASFCTTAQSGMVAGICFIEQADKHERLPLAPHDVVSALFPQVACYSREPSVLDKIMHTISLIIEGCPCFRLRFREDADFWPLLTQ